MTTQHDLPHLRRVVDGDIGRTPFESTEPFELVVGNPPQPVSLFNPAVYATALKAQNIVIERNYARPTWEVILRTPLPLLHRLEIVDIHRGAGQFSLIGFRTDFDKLYPSLVKLRLTNVSLDWSSLVLPPALCVLEIDNQILLPRGSKRPPPELEPGLSVPSLADLHRLLLSCPRLYRLSLYGIFASSISITQFPSEPIHLPELKYLVLAGNGAPIDALIGRLSSQSLTNVHIISPVWSIIHSVPRLSNQMGLTSLHPVKTAIVDAGPPYPNARPSIFFTVMVKPGPLIIILECLDAQSDQWCYMVSGSGIRGINQLAIRDRSSFHPSIQPQGAIQWQNIATVFSDVHIIRMMDGTRWASSLSPTLYITASPVLPLLRYIEFHLDEGVRVQEMECMGQWLRDIRRSGRGVMVRIGREAMSEINMGPFLARLPEGTDAVFRNWMSGAYS